MKLAEAFDLQDGDIVAFVGAGGKTSALVGLGTELEAAGRRVLATTTTRIGRDQLDAMPACKTFPSAMSPALIETSRFTFVYDHLSADKAIGLRRDQFSQLIACVAFDFCLVEADGARMLPLKAPKAHEPVIPPQTTLVVPMLSLSALGKPLTEDNVYNAGFIAERYGYRLGDPVRPEWLARLLQDDAMLLKSVPAGARVIPLLNQTPRRGHLYKGACQIADQVMHAQSRLDAPRICKVVIGCLRDPDPIHTLRRM